MATRIWTPDESRAIDAVKCKIQGPRFIEAFEYICKHQGDTTSSGNLQSEKVKQASSLDDKQLTQLRERVAYHSAKLDPKECPFVFVIDRSICRIMLIPKGSQLDLSLGRLWEREQLPPNGHLVAGSDVVIYVHQASGLPAQLREQMLKNMEEAIEYRYFIPQEHSKSIVDLIVEMLGSQPDDALPRLRQSFEVNIVRDRMPILFSIHNARNEEQARMYVRTLDTPKQLSLYAEGAEAHNQYQLLMQLWKPVSRTQKSPIVLPCQGGRMDPSLRRDLSRRLLTNKTCKDQKSANKIIRFVLGTSSK